MRTRIRGGLLVDPATGMESRADLCIENDTIAELGNAGCDDRVDLEIDATDLVVCPGLIDLAVRFREPGFEHEASLESELAAAVAGGVTAVACPPEMDPPLDEPGLVEMLTRRASMTALASVHPLGALTRGLKGEKLAEMAALSSAGCIAFSQDNRPIADLNVLYRAMQYAATFGYPVWLRPQEPALSRGGVAHEGEVATRLGLPGIPAIAETVAVASILLLARETGARVHLCRLSASHSVAMVREAKAQGARVTCDVSAHHVHLSDVDIGYFDANCRLSPPLRGSRDREALASGLADGTIDAICSDHSPVDSDGKEVPFSEADPGATGLETLLSLAIRWGEARGLATALGPVTTGPARVLGLEPPRLAVGSAADLCVFDANCWWRVEPKNLLSRGKNTPFNGYELQGQACFTFVGGRLVFERAGRGHRIRRAPHDQPN